MNWPLLFIILALESFLLSFFLTIAMRRAAVKWGVLDQPGERKIHESPMPLLGGVAIFLAFNVVVIVNLVLLHFSGAMGYEWVETTVLAFLGDRAMRGLLGLFVGGVLIFALGIVDDLNALRPKMKLFGQIGAALVLVLAGIRSDLFIENVLAELTITSSISPDVLQILSFCLASVLTVFWIVLMTNAMNFLDNMDGLCAGVAVIASGSFFLCVYPRQEYFVCVLLVVFAGSCGGFLIHNRAPAKIFMGDAGSMFCGYILGAAAVLGTFYKADGESRLAVAAPLFALAVPLFDILGVVLLRLRRGESIMMGDKRHFSHRLVERGMSRRRAVQFSYLVAASAGLGGVLLSRVGPVGTGVILVQTVGIFMLIVLMMRPNDGPKVG